MTQILFDYGFTIRQFAVRQRTVEQQLVEQQLVEQQSGADADRC